MEAGFDSSHNISPELSGEQVPHESEEKLRSLLNACTDSILLTDTEGTFIDLNETVARRIGKSVEELVGTNAYDTLPRSVAQRRREKAAEAIRTKEPVRFTDEREGNVYDINIFPVLGSEDKVERLAIYARNITAQKRAENSLRESEEKCRALTDSIPGFIFVVDGEGIIQFVNRTPQSMSPDDLVGTNVMEYTPPEYHQIQLNAIRDTVETGRPNLYEVQIAGPSGRPIWFETRTAPIERDGRISEVILVVVDITDRKLVENLLRESEEKYRSLIDLTSDSVYELDENLKYTYVSGRGKDISGRNPEDHIGKTPFDFMPEEEKTRVLKFVQENLDSPQAMLGFENVLIGQDGRPVIVETSAVPIHDAQGNFSGYLCVDRDITDRKQAEEMLRRSEAKYRTLFEELRDIVFTTTPEGKILDVNPAGLELLGYSSKEELSQVNISRDIYWNPHDREKFQKAMATDGFVKDYELLLKRNDGKRMIVVLSANAVYDDNGTIIEYRGVMHDMTDRRRLERQLHQSSKLVSVGELATGVAHEINNPMAAIDVHAGVIRDIFDDMKDKIDESYREQVENSITTIEQQIERCRSITANLLSFTRMPQSEGMNFGMNELLMKTAELVSSMSLSDTEVTFDFDHNLPTYWGSPNLLQQVFVNLLTNAFKATGPHDKITISTGLADNEYIQIQFTDTGHGIPEDIRERIFDPFFTTNPEGEGTGLGLSISYYIVKQMDGEISVDSTPESGTTFVVTLPLIEKVTDVPPTS